MIIFIAASALTVLLETSSPFAHLTARAHFIAAAAILVPAAVAWTLIRRHGEKNAAAAPRPGYGSLRQGPRR